MSTATARPTLHLPARYLAIVQDILRRYLPQAEVWAYGSRVQGDHYDASDLDLVVRQLDDLTRPQPDLDEVAAAFSDSDLPILVQILDWARIPASFREEIESAYVVLTSADGVSAVVAGEEVDAGASSDRVDWLPSSAWEPGHGSSVSRVEVAKQSFGSRIPEQGLGTRKNTTRRAFGELIDAGVLDVTDGYRAKNSELGGTGLIFLRAGHITDTHIEFAGVDRFHDELTPKLKEKLSKAGDVAVTTKGNSTGRTSFVTPTMPPFVYSPHLSRWRSMDHDQLEPGFLRYWSSSREFDVQLRGLAASTDMAPYLSLRDQRRLEITLPPIDEQRTIAGILGALDDKIEQNRRTAQALERLARAIFRVWFVDFEPVKAKAAGATSFPSMPQPVFEALPTRFVDSEMGSVPEGWDLWQHRVGELEAQGALSVGDGYRAKRSELAESGFPFIRAGNVNGTVKTEGAELLCAESTAKAGAKRSRVWDTLFTSKGTVGRIGLITPWTRNVVYSPQVCYWRSLDERQIDPFFLHLWICSVGFTNQWMAVKGNTDMADFVSLSDQRAMRLAVPTASLQNAIRSIVEPLFRLKAQTDFESWKLTELRDYLLPKLLSGELRVSDTEGATDGLP